MDTAFDLKIFQTAYELNKAAAEFIITQSKKAIAVNGRFIIALSGGKTPEKLYSMLSENSFAARIDWEHTHIFWGDERCVSLDDEQNNAYRAISILLNHVAIPKENIHRIPVNLAPSVAASEYYKEINNFFRGETPVFDLILLGLGTNGHTASLFPGTQVLLEQKPGVKAVYVESLKNHRITMTAPLINLAHHILILVTGINKAKLIESVFSMNDKYPVHLVKPENGELHWFIDKEAASALSN